MALDVEGIVNGGVDRQETFWYTNNVEPYFALLKRGMTGSFHNESEAYPYRYLAEFDFRYNRRKATDDELADELSRSAKDKDTGHRGFIMPKAAKLASDY